MLKQIIYMSILVVVISGCSTKYPLGLSEEEWELLPIEKKTIYSEKQAKIDEKIRQEQLTRWQIQKQYELEAKKAEQTRLDNLYQRAQYGDIINVNLYGGQYSAYDEFISIRPTAFTLARGEVKEIKVIMKNKKNYTYRDTFWAMFTPMGNKIVLSPKRVSLDEDSEGIVILNNGRWHKEQTYKRSSLDQYDKLKDLIIGVRYADFTRRY